MQHSTIKLFLLLIISVLTFSSCEKAEEWFPSDEERIQKTWRFDQVTFTKTLSFNCQDKTDEYDGVTIEFHDNHSATWRDNVSGTELEGNWEIETYFTYYNEQNQQVKRLEAEFYDPASGENIRLDWDNLNVTKKKMTGNMRSDGGNYRFRMRKN